MGFPIPDTGSVTEDTSVSGGYLTATGDIDWALLDDTGWWTAQTITGSYGSQLVIDADGNWTYTALNSHASIQALDDGDTLTEVFTVTTQRPGFAARTSTITITINGQDEPPCFTRGTRIMTDQGARAVETLKAGDRVVTRDAGLQPIRWIGQRRLFQSDLAANEKLRPVRIVRGSLGAGLPDQDILVSPMHRILLNGVEPTLLLGESEVLCAARHLSDREGFSIVAPEQVDYFHILFDDHQLVQSDGLISESFYPGTVGIGGFAAAAREEVFSLFPQLRSLPESYGRPARMILKRHEAAVIANRRWQSHDAAPDGDLPPMPRIGATHRISRTAMSPLPLRQKRRPSTNPPLP